MVMTINPMVHGGRRLRTTVTFAFHVLGGVSGGVAAASTVGLLVAVTNVRSLPERIAVVLAVLVAGVSLVTDLRLAPWRVRGLNRQVSIAWRSRVKPDLAGFIYGLGLGAAFTTRIYFASTYAVFLIAGLLLPFSALMLVGGAFGFARSSAAYLGLLSGERAHFGAQLHRRERWRPMVRASNIVAEGVLLITALWLL